MLKKCFSGAIRDRSFIAFASIALFGLPTPAFAYIDPGAGSMAYQAIAAVVVGAAFFVRQLAARSKAAWRQLAKRGNRSSTPSA